MTPQRSTNKFVRLKLAIRPCPVCANTRVEVLHNQRFILSEGHFLPAAYDVVWCPTCGFAYADAPASQEVYDRYYAESSKYEDNTTSTGGGGSDWDGQRLRDTATAVSRMVPDLQARILDIGCANGGLLGELKRLGFSDLLGVDPSPACVANTEVAHGVPAVAGSFRQMPPNVGRFDLVMLSHVLEHVADLQSTVHHLIPLLNDQGLLYIEVPDASRYDKFLIAPFQDFNTEHINHFSLASLENLLGPHGFSLEAGGQKEVYSSPGCPYPAVYGFFRYSLSSVRPPSGTQARSYHVDTTFRECLVRYIAASQAKIEKIERQLAPFCSPTESLIVWGTGQLTMKLLAETSLARANIKAFVDGNPINHGKKLLGVPILAPEQITVSCVPILIATLLHQREISERIRGPLRLENPVITLD